jgi:hypothetical protein
VAVLKRWSPVGSCEVIGGVVLRRDQHYSWDQLVPKREVVKKEEDWPFISLASCALSLSHVFHHNANTMM